MNIDQWAVVLRAANYKDNISHVVSWGDGGAVFKTTGGDTVYTSFDELRDRIDDPTHRYFDIYPTGQLTQNGNYIPIQ